MLELRPIFNALLRSKAGALMLLFQIALTTAIVSNAAFIIYDRIQYLQQDTGYPEDEVFSFRVLTFGNDVDLVQRTELDEDMLRSIPGVIDAGFFQEVPLSGSGSASGFGIVSADQVTDEQQQSTRAAYTFADHHAINTLGVNLIAGRNFNPDEVVVSQSFDKVPNVAIVSQAFIDDLFGEGEGMGETVYLGSYPLKIIGVVEKMMGPWLKDSAAENFVIIPLVQAAVYQKFVVRTSADERTAVMRQIEDLMLDAYDQRVINNIDGMDIAKEDYNASDVLMLRMLLVLIVVLLLITALGIFGLTVFNINKRTKQIGTRRALGARKSAIVRYFLVENTFICAAGLIVGCAGAIYLGNLLLEEYSLPALDNSYVIATAIGVFVTSVLSVLIPANRAANISPSVATRSI